MALINLIIMTERVSRIALLCCQMLVICHNATLHVVVPSPQVELVARATLP